MHALSRPLAVVCLASASAFALLGCQTTPANASASESSPRIGQPGKDVIWVPTQQPLLDKMLDMAQLSVQDYLVDLGSGDGRGVITAAQRGARALGVELNGDLVALSRQRAEEAGVGDRARFLQADLFDVDFSDADVVMLFLLPSLNLKLRPQLLEMAPGTRVVSNFFDMADWKPDETFEVIAKQDDICPQAYCIGHLWIVPASIGGVWQMDNGWQLEIDQEFQTFGGFMRTDSFSAPSTIEEGHLNGNALGFVTGGEQYKGYLAGDELRGTLANGMPWRASRSQP